MQTIFSLHFNCLLLKRSKSCFTYVQHTNNYSIIKKDMNSSDSLIEQDLGLSTSGNQFGALDIKAFITILFKNKLFSIYIFTKKK